MTIERAFASGSTTLDQSGWTLIDSMQVTPGAGDFLAIFSMEVQFASSPGSEILSVAIYVNDVQQAHSVRKIQANSSVPNMFCPIVTSALVSPTAGQVVDVRYQISGGSMTGTERELNTVKENTTSIQDADTVSDTIASATWATLDNMTETPPAGNYLLVFTAYAATPDDETVGFRLSVGGSPVAHTERQLRCESSANPTTYPVLIAASISPNGSQVVEIEWARISGSGTQTCYERNMILLEVDSGDISQATGTVTDNDTTTTDKQIDDMLISDPGAATYLAIFSGTQFYGSLGAPGAGATYSIYNGGVKETDTQRYHFHEDSLDNCERPVFTTGRVTVASGTDDIQAYWQGSSTDSRDCYERTLVIIEDPFPPPPWGGAVVADTNTSTGAAGTSHTVSLAPNISADDLLIIFFATDGDNTVTDWDGFTELGSESNGTANFFAIAYKKAVGTEGSSITVTTSESEPSSHICFRITGHIDPATQAPELSTVAEASDAYPDPTILTPTGGAKDYMWIHASGWDYDRTVSAWNPNFADNRLYSSNGTNQGCSCAVSTREENVASKNPASITIDTGDTWCSWTVAVHPAAGQIQELAGSLAATSTLTNILLSTTMKLGAQDIPGQSDLTNILLSKSFDFGIATIDGQAGLTDLLLSQTMKLNPADIVGASSVLSLNMKLTMKILPEDIIGQSVLGNVPLEIPIMKLFGTIDGIADLTNLLLSMTMKLSPADIVGQSTLDGVITFLKLLIGSLDATSDVPDTLMSSIMKMLPEDIAGQSVLENIPMEIAMGLIGNIDGTGGLTDLLLSLTMKLGAEDIVAAATADGVLTVTAIVEMIGTCDALSDLPDALMKTTMELIGNIPATSEVDGIVELSLKLIGTIDSTADLTNILMSLEMDLIGTLDSSSGLSGALQKFLSITGTIDGQSVVADNRLLYLTQKLIGSTAGQSELLNILLSTTMEIIGDLDGLSGLSGILKRTYSFTGTIDAIAGVSGIIKLAQKFSGIISATSAVSGIINLTIKIIGSIDSISSLSGLLKLDMKLIGSLVGQSLLSGVLTIFILVLFEEPISVSLANPKIYVTMDTGYYPITAELANPRIYIEAIT